MAARPVSAKVRLKWLEPLQGTAKDTPKSRIKHTPEYWAEKRKAKSEKKLKQIFTPLHILDQAPSTPPHYWLLMEASEWQRACQGPNSAEARVQAGRNVKQSFQHSAHTPPIGGPLKC